MVCLKSHAAFVVTEPTPAGADSGVGSYQVVVFSRYATDDNERLFRRPLYENEDKLRRFEFFTIHLTLDAAEHRQRWQIELLLRAIKQRIKSFAGTSVAALTVQIWSGRIARLVVRCLQRRSRLQWHVRRFVALRRHQLLVYRHLWRFLVMPFEGPPPLRSDYLPP